MCVFQPSMTFFLGNALISIFRFRCPRCCGCRAWLWSGEKFVTKNHGRHSWWAATSASHLGSRHQLQWTCHLISHSWPSYNRSGESGMIFRMSSTRSFLLDEAKRIWGSMFFMMFEDWGYRPIWEHGPPDGAAFSQILQLPKWESGICNLQKPQQPCWAIISSFIFFHFFILPLTYIVEINRVTESLLQKTNGFAGAVALGGALLNCSSRFGKGIGTHCCMCYTRMVDDRQRT